MNKIRLLKKLETYPLFTINDISKITQKSPEYVRLLLYRLLNGQHIQRIEKGKYTTHEDPLVYASHIITPSYLSLWTSLRYYNLTTQFPLETTIMTAKNKKQITVGEETITFTKTKHMWGYEKINYNGFEVFMADKEKTAIDGLQSMKLPTDEINNVISECNQKKLVDYAIKTRNKSVIKKTGYLMEHNNIQASPLLEYIDGNYVPLDGNRPKKGERNKRWKIIVNTALE